MPIMTGLEATKIIRDLEDKEKSKTPIFAVSASILEKEQAEQKRIGINGFINKPYHPSDIVNIIKEYVN